MPGPTRAPLCIPRTSEDGLALDEPTPQSTLEFTSSTPDRSVSPDAAQGGPGYLSEIQQQDADSNLQPEAQGARGALGSRVVNRTNLWREGVRFVGRRQELQKLEKHLRVGGQACEKVAVLFGETEFGKTSIAEEFVRRHSSQYGMVVWLGASQATLNSQCMRVAQLLGQNVDEISAKALDGDNQWQRVNSAILASKKDPTLLVMDDLEELGKLSIFLAGARSSHLHILVTTRALKGSLQELQQVIERSQGLSAEAIALIRVGVLEKEAEKTLLGDCFKLISTASLDRLISNLKRKPSLLAEAYRVSNSPTKAENLVDRVEFSREEAFRSCSFIVPLDFSSAVQDALDELRFGSYQGGFTWTLVGRVMSLFGSQVGWWAWTLACVSAFFNKSSIPEDLLSEAAFR
jgi:hypothetical protein